MGVSKTWRLPALIWLFSIGLIYSTTLIGKYLVGSDLHLEYYFANQTLLNGWDSSVPHAYNGALSVTLLAPFLSKLFSIDLYTVFKFVFPFIYSFVPVILYFIYRKYVSDKKAFIAALLFIIVPTFFNEITGIGKEQIGELFLALTFLTLVNKRWKLTALFGIITIMAHYSMGFILAFYLVAYVGGLVVLTRRLDWKLIASVVFILVSGTLFLGNVADGIPLKSAQFVGDSYFTPINQLTHPQGYNISYINTTAGGYYQDEPAQNAYLDLGNRENIVQTALGLDFFDVPIEGKIFRLAQFSIQALVLLGCWLLWKRKARPEIIVLVAASFLLLLACVVVPGFSKILNASRFYHLAMFFIPVVIVQINWHKFLIVLVSVYFTFTSGLVFESFKLLPMEVNVPYSIAASHNRLDLGTNFSDDDVVCAKWLQENVTDTNIYSDIYGLLIIQETLGLHPLYLILPDTDIDGYLFLRSYSIEQNYVTIWRSPGLREYVPIDVFNEQLVNRVIVFQSGSSIVYSPEISSMDGM